jgi:hypothetical protein
MNNKMLKYGLVLAVVVIIILLGYLRVNVPEKSESSSSSGLVTSPVRQGQTPSRAVTPETQTSDTRQPSKPVITSLSTGTFHDFEVQLSANQNKCNDAASAQYGRLYRNVLQSSAFVSYYVSKNGLCYAQITGISQADYSSSMVAHMYFRNVTKDVLLLECSNNKGVLNGAIEDFSCADKVTGQSIIKPQYDSMLYKYITQ